MSKSIPHDFAEQIRTARRARGWTQAELATELSVTNVTVSRWEKGRVEPSLPIWERFQDLAGLQPKSPSRFRKHEPTDVLDFMGDGLAVRALVEGARLAYGHLANPTFATEISKIDPLPHQRIAVYEH